MFSRSSLNEIVETKRGFYLLMKWFSSHIRVFVWHSGRVLKCGEVVERKVGREMVRSRCLMFRFCYADLGGLFLYEVKYSWVRVKA